MSSCPASKLNPMWVAAWHVFIIAPLLIALGWTRCNLFGNMLWPILMGLGVGALIYHGMRLYQCWEAGRKGGIGMGPGPAVPPS